jgi:hypothetical protein
VLVAELLKDAAMASPDWVGGENVIIKDGDPHSARLSCAGPRSGSGVRDRCGRVG